MSAAAISSSISMMFAFSALSTSTRFFADLNGLYIHPDYQHIGLGKEFFDIFVEEIKKKNINKFMLGVLKDNLQARKAYEKWGGKLDTTYSLPYENCGVKTEEVFYIYEL